MSNLVYEFIDPVDAVRHVPPGAWAVGVSGGADSVALAHLMCERAADVGDVLIDLVHLNHQARGQESDDDERFVQSLSLRDSPSFISAKRDGVERDLVDGPLPPNTSARFRALRHALFKSVVEKDRLQGVLLAHHADDQAETVAQRLLRGSGWQGLAGMSPDTTVRDGLRIVRPLLRVRREALREYLTSRGRSWREDSSNQSKNYQRNVVRQALAGRDDATAGLLRLSDACAALRAWVRDRAPQLEPSFRTQELADLPRILARHSAAEWLAGRGVARDEIAPAAIDRVLHLCADAASPAKLSFAGNVMVRRRGGRVFAESG